MKAAETGAQGLTVESNMDTVKDNNSIKESISQIIVSTKTMFDDKGNEVGKVKGYFNDWESAGTQKWLYTSFAILAALSNGSTLLIDEFDAKFHPNLTLKIVQLFNQPNTNPKNAQLIFATHDTGLLRRANLRRDQICLVDKNKFGISSIKNLIQFKGVRKDASYEKEYLEGSYGAVAYLDDIDNIIADFLTIENASESE
jgi:AAA15 family ATPase/GTPase